MCVPVEVLNVVVGGIMVIVLREEPVNQYPLEGYFMANSIIKGKHIVLLAQYSTFATSNAHLFSMLLFTASRSSTLQIFRS